MNAAGNDIVRARPGTALTLIALMALGLAFLPATPSRAQDEEAAAEQRYQVEVVVFRHLDQARSTPEIPRLVEPEIEDLLDQQLARMAVEPAPLPAADNLLTGLAETAAPPFWTPANASGGYLQADTGRLTRLDAYEVLAHLAWVQTAEDVSLAETIDVEELGSRGFDGTVRLYRKRYLHLAVDLALDSPGSGALAGLNNEARAAIVDSRRMRPGRTVYFDQPQFGVLATVNRVK